MAKIEAYLAIEATVAGAVHAAWWQDAILFQAEVGKALRAGDFDAARGIVDGFTMGGHVATVRDDIERTYVSALLFGASQLAPIKDTALYRGALPVPDFLDTVVDQFAEMAEVAGTRQIKDAVQRLITAEELQQVTKAETVASLADKLNAAVLGTGRGLIDIGANLTTSRLVSFGFLAQARETGIDSYQITEVLDKRICPVCLQMHGKTFQVPSEYDRVQTLLRTRDPEQLKNLAPWPSQTRAGVEHLKTLSAEQMQALGFGTPPYHPLCRGLLQPAGSVTEYIPPPPSPIQTGTDLLPTFIPPKKVYAPKKVPAAQPTKIVDAEHRALTLELIEQLPSQNLREAALALYTADDMAEVIKILIDAGLIVGPDDLV